MYLRSVFSGFRLLAVLVAAQAAGCGKVSKIEPSRSPLSQSAGFRALTYNIWGLPWPLIRDSSRIADIAKTLAGTGADVIAIQEAFDSSTSVLEGIPEYPYFTRGDGPSFPTKLVGSGLLILSRWPIVRSATTRYTYCRGTDCNAAKGVLFARILVEGKGEVDVFDTHMNADDQNADIRKEQLKQYVEFARNYIGPRTALFLGDFNFAPDSDEYAYFTSSLEAHDLYAEYAAAQPADSSFDKNGYTSDWERNPNIPHSDRRQRIDYIFYRGPSGDAPRIFSTKIDYDSPLGGRHLSDHFAVLTELDLFLIK
jgi:endonuclease/exonuclease/phosphatase family metal-dependent hydrolase